jgi:hypothetical protein
MAGMASAREPKTLTASANLARALRACRALAEHALAARDDERWSILVEELKWGFEPRVTAPRIDLHELDGIERQLGFALPDDVLILAALDEPLATVVTGIRDLGSVLDKALEEDAAPPPNGCAWISSVYHEPFAEIWEGAHGGSYLDLAIEKHADPTLDSVVLVAEDGRIGENVRRVPLHRFILESFAQQLPAKDAAIASEAAKDTARELGPMPLLVRAPPAAVAERWVTHTKFGRGRVLDASGTGPDAKLRLRFDDGSERVLLARFVTDAPSS